MSALNEHVSSDGRLASARRGFQTFDTGTDVAREQDGLGRIGVHQSFAERQLIFREGDSCDHFFRVINGLVRIEKNLFDGRRQVLGLFFSGDCFGFSATGEYVYTAEAVTACDIVKYKRTHLSSLITDQPALGHHVAAMVNDELRVARERSLILGSRSPLERVATFLVLLASRQQPISSQNNIRVVLTREEIGDYLGICMETVSRCFSRLKAIGVIALPQPHAVEVLSVDALEDLANPDVLEVA